ncbi:hypothetical protein [Mycobacterium sp. 1081908.1]|uniref:hypothetical protein n=1 Tax=Mycobacterium sp. 1081908.1 TaxID=1834066 RepID=UPI0012EAB871|nr:hypothetical protein [Mycobacterium sp. 1081908.1]
MESEDRPLGEDVGADAMGFYSRPQLEELPDGSWRAYYPASDWSITAASRDAAIAKLQLEDQRRSQEQPDYTATRYRALRRHLIEPIPGVYAISQEEAERIRSTPDPQAEFNRIADEMDAGNIPNPPA